MRLDSGIRVTWLGHSTFRIAYEDRTLLIDPWVMSNPVCPDDAGRFENIDVMLITHGHSDHIADAVALGREFQPTVAANFEIIAWLEARGIEHSEPMNKGGTIDVDGLQVTMTHAFHSSTITDEDGNTVPAGEAGGFVVRFPNGFAIYHAGDTAVFGDMKLIGELYAPDLAMLPIGSRFTMDPREAALAVRLVGAPAVIPIHYGTFPLLTGTPDEFQQLTADDPVEIIVLHPGETLE